MRRRSLRLAIRSRSSFLARRFRSCERQWRTRSCPWAGRRFYKSVFGVREYYRDASSIQVQGPGPYDVIAFERNRAKAGKTGGITHFGFRLTKPKDIGKAVEQVKKAGGRVLRTGEFGPGSPFAYVADPDGYEIEIWFE
jgi:predicted enzyme related to lactoylglutathione lyase